MAELLYAIVTALIVGLGFILEIRRERTERARTDPSTDARLARIEAQDPVREAMERLAKCEAHLEEMHDRLAEFQAAVDAAAESLAVDPTPSPRRRRGKGPAK